MAERGVTTCYVPSSSFQQDVASQLRSVYLLPELSVRNELRSLCQSFTATSSSRQVTDLAAKAMLERVPRAAQANKVLANHGVDPYFESLLQRCGLDPASGLLFGWVLVWRLKAASPWKTNYGRPRIVGGCPECVCFLIFVGAGSI